jgi:nudix-type nucleoside diphosphatase (YffH/AdpP family)
MSQQTTGTVVIEARETLSDEWYKLEKVTFRQYRSNGSEQTLEREVFHNGPGAAVVPFDRTRGAVLLVRQLRIAAAVNGDIPHLVEACAGVIDEGDLPTDTVRKEAEQELGYRLRDVRKIFELYMSPGASAEKLHLFVAEYGPEDRISAGGGLEEEGEEIRVVEIPLNRAWEMVGSGQIVDAKTVLLLQHLWMTVSR